MSKFLDFLYPWLLLLAFTPGSFSQSTPGPAGKSDYSKEAFVYLQSSTKASFKNDGTETQQIAGRIRIQSDAGVQRFGILNFSYQSAIETIDIQYVRVHKPDGSVVETPSSDVQDVPADVTRAAPFYSDLHEKHAAVKGLAPGDILEFAYALQLNKPLAPGQFWFQYTFLRSNVILQEDLEVRVPRERAVKMQCPTAKPSIHEEGSERIYTWKASNLQVVEDDDAEPGLEKVLQQSEGRLPQPDVQISSFQTWQEVGRWYDTLQHDRIIPSPQIVAKAAELTKNAADDDAKLHAIYAYVSTQFRYIGIAFGIGRYQPHSASDVLNNRYGDCKDKHTLLAALLTASGFKIYPALISSVHEVDSEVPSPGQFNHVISVVSRGGSYMWLDTTPEVAPFGYLIPQLIDKHALVVTDTQPSQLVATPSGLPFSLSLIFTIEGKLSDDGTFDAKVERTDRGDSEPMLRAAFRQLSQAQWKQLAQRISYASGFAGDVSNVEASSPETLETPFHLTYNYTRKKYGDWDNRRITPALPFLMLPEIKNDSITTRLFLGSPGEVTLSSRIELPKQYTTEPSPAVDLKYDFAEYHSSSELKDGVLISKRRLVVKKREVASATLDDYKNFRKAVMDDYDRMFLLTSKSDMQESPSDDPLSYSRQAFATLPDSSNPEANRLVREGFSQMANDRPAVAINSLDQAVKLDPQFVKAWTALAIARFVSRQPDSGLEALRSAIKADPKQVLPYKILGSSLFDLNRAAEAVNVMNDAISATAPDPDLHSILGSSLFRMKRYKEAAAEFETAITLGKDRVSLESLMGMAYLRAGDVERASAAFDKALALDSSPRILNDIGYEMAEANHNLTKALDYAQRAVEAVEDESKSVELDTLSTTDLARMSALSAYWDTLGWVYFHIGNFDDAEKYLKAAWLLSQSPVVGDHLAQAYEKQGKSNLAYRTYEMALMASRGGSDMTEVENRLAKLLRSQAKRFSGKGAENLAAMRTTSLPRLVPGTASADFFLLISEGPTVEDVKFLHGDESLKVPVTKALQTAKLNLSFPDNGPTLLIRKAAVSCSSLSSCVLVLIDPVYVRSVN